MDGRNRQRIYLSIFFFLSGVSFASWASRIPTIKSAFDLNDAQLGTILLCMPISSLMGLPLSGFLVARYDSRIPMTVAFVLLSIALTAIGFSSSQWFLVASICIFAFSLRILNIAMNTQAITLQKLFDKKINGSFHGLWSTGGIVGVAFSTVLVALNISMDIHLAIVSALTLIYTLFAYKHLLRNDRAPSGNKFKIGKPDPHIVYLGLMLFFAAICEGGMFDWSGIYFKEVVHVEVFTWGYLTFMICMAISRFASDKLIEIFGMPRTYILSSALIISGIVLAILVPSFWPALIGFCLVGFGTASIIPMTFLLAGTSKKYSAGLVISIIATYSIVGMLIGPPLVGYIAHAFNLRIAFVLFAFAGLMLIPMSQIFFRYQKRSSKIEETQAFSASPQQG